MAIIFDGREYALKKKELLRVSVNRLREKGIIPHLATILVGDNKASELYTNLKKKFIESVNCQVDVYDLPESTKYSDIELLIKSLNEDETVNGIMVQFPLPEKLSDKKEEIIDLIDDTKDVDGLKEDSKFLHPTSKAVLEILALATYEIQHLQRHETKMEVKTICVVGASGMVGRPLVKALQKMNFEVLECNSNTKNLIEKTILSDVIVSATGEMNLITPDMVKPDAIIIDVGSPFGDVSPTVEKKVSFLTPVPGGVGPVTITCLAENLILASDTES